MEVVPVYMYKTDNEPNILPFDDRKDLLFIGSFKHKPNVDGVLWFADEVFDKIKKKFQMLNSILLVQTQMAKFLNCNQKALTF